MMTECPFCGDKFEKIGSHWSMSSTCSYPEISSKLMDIVKGCLMGDGCVHKRDGYLVLEMSNKDYLYYLDDQFGYIGRGVRETRSSDYQKDRRGFENPKALYEWSTRPHPTIKQLRSRWYRKEKVWPDDINLSPTILKHWYVGDGTFDSKGRIRISSIKESDLDKVSKYFVSSGLPEPKRSSHQFYWSVSNTELLFDYIGEPLPGFEYKWPDRYK